MVDHIKELRSRIIYCLGFLIVGFAVCWYWSDFILRFISTPIQPYLEHTAGRFIFTAPMDEILAHIKVASYGALILCWPVLLYHIWKFIAPGLYKKERLGVIAFILFGSTLFALGILFIYYLVYPASFHVILNFGESAPFISIKEYLSFFIKTTLAFGFLFEIPLILSTLTWVELVSVKTLKSGRRYALVLLAVVAAIVTPPDVISMFILLGPLYLLYELSIGISILITSSKKK